MSLAKDLMAVGMPGEQAKRVGFAVSSLASAGTTSADAAQASASATLVLVTGAAASGIKLSADAELGVPYVYAGTDANAKLIYPPTGGQINGDTVTTGTVPLVARGTVMCIRVDNTNWVAVIGAAG